MDLLLHTSFVPKCIITMSGRVAESQPGSWFWSATFVTRAPPWPSLSPSYGTPHPWAGSVPTMSMLVKPPFCSLFHNRARQQPGDPVIESPRGMIRTGAASAGRATSNPSTTSRAATTAFLFDIASLPRPVRRDGRERSVARPRGEMRQKP